MASGGAKVRAVAAELVDAVVSQGLSLDAAIATNEGRVASIDRSLLRMLAYGTLRNHWQLQDWVTQLLDRPLKRKDSVIHALLCVGLYQLRDTRIPDHAAVSQTVEAARQLRRPKLAGLLNACLRRFQRENIAAAAATTDEARWNHPQWLIDSLRRDWPDDWETLLAANNERAPMWLRANTARNTATEYQERLAQADIAADLLPAIPEGLRLTEPQLVEDLERRVVDWSRTGSLGDDLSILALEWS